MLKGRKHYGRLQDLRRRKKAATALAAGLALVFFLLVLENTGKLSGQGDFRTRRGALAGAVSEDFFGRSGSNQGHLSVRIQWIRTVRKQADLVRQEAERLKEIREQQAYQKSVTAMTAGQIVDTARLWPDQLKKCFYEEEILPGTKVYERINDCSYRENPHIALSHLRYLRVLHVGFDGETHVGEMIVHEEIAEDVLQIFQKLYEARYPIERMRLVDDYQADDNVSMADNNSSAFNYRYIATTTKLSNHSWGKAVDINPLYNPYIYTAGGQLHVDPEGSQAYVDRSGDCPYMIDHEDLCCRLFLEHGFTWGGDWDGRKDYQHFEKK